MPRKGVTIKARLNLKIDADLKDWAKVYAKRRGRDITTLICDYLRFLKKKEEDTQKEIVEQI